MFCQDKKGDKQKFLVNVTIATKGLVSEKL